jgi:hypothetical protein
MVCRFGFGLSKVYNTYATMVIYPESIATKILAKYIITNEIG